VKNAVLLHQPQAVVKAACLSSRQRGSRVMISEVFIQAGHLFSAATLSDTSLCEINPGKLFRSRSSPLPSAPVSRADIALLGAHSSLR